MQRVLETAYPWHNYGKLPIGNRSDIENVPIDRLAAFYQKYYQPDNAVLTIAGKFDEAKALALIVEHTGQDSASPRASWTRPTQWSRRRMASAP